MKYSLKIIARLFTIALLFWGVSELTAQEDNVHPNRLIVILEPGVIDFPRIDTGRFYDGEAPADLVQFKSWSRLPRILAELNWIDCKKLVPELNEGDSVSYRISHREYEDPDTTRCYFEEIDSRTYILDFKADSSRSKNWIFRAKQLIDSCEEVEGSRTDVFDRFIGGVSPTVLESYYPSSPDTSLGGKVMVRITIGQGGRSVAPTVEYSTLPEEFEGAAIEAAGKWLWKIQGQGIGLCEGQIVIPFEFKVGVVRAKD